MKIAYVANVRVPSERAHAAQIVHMCQAFSRAGAQVTLFVNKRVDSSLHEVGTFFSIQPNFSLVRISHGFLRPEWWWSFYVSEFIFVCSSLPKLVKGNFDIIYARSEWVVFLLSLFFSCKRLVWESHEAKHNFAVKHILRQGIRCVVISAGIEKYYQEKQVPEKQIIVADDAIDDSFFEVLVSQASARGALGLGIDEKIVMYIGGFDAWKGIDTFCAASQYSDKQFVVIGGYETQVQAYQLRYPKVRFLGARPYRDLKHHQRAADVLVVPNSATSALGAEYTSPLKLFAHMASGVPLVVSAVPSLSSVVNSTEAQFFIPDDVVDLASVIDQTFATMPVATENARTLKERSRAFTWHERAKKILTFITT